MAIYKNTLDPVLTRRDLPYRFINKTILGNDYLDIYAGWNLTVPNVWAISSAYLLITTDATVANRQPSIYKKLQGNNIEAAVRGNVTASSTAGFSLGKTESFGSSSALGSAYQTLKGKAFMFGGDDFIRVATGAGVAGDVLQVYIQFRWLNWELGMVIPRSQKPKKKD